MKTVQVHLIIGTTLVEIDEKFTVTNDKQFPGYEAFYCKNTSDTNLSTNSFREKTISRERKTPKIKLCLKNSTLPMKKSR